MTPKWFYRKYGKAIYGDKNPPDDQVAAGVATLFTCIFLYGFIIGRTWYGIYKANNPSECHVKSIADIIVAPFYALGCNIGKDRWNKSLIIGE